MMRIEHLAIQVEHPIQVANWYISQFGFQIKRSSGAPTFVHFLADETGQIMVEIYNNPKVKTPDYQTMDPLQLHLAFSCNRRSIKEQTQLLVDAGATVVAPLEQTPLGDHLQMLRDPWGFPIQLCYRKDPMI